METLGYEMASTFHFIELSPYEADVFFEKFRILKNGLEEWRVEEMEKQRKV